MKRFPFPFIKLDLKDLSVSNLLLSQQHPTYFLLMLSFYYISLDWDPIQVVLLMRIFEYFVYVRNILICDNLADLLWKLYQRISNIPLIRYRIRIKYFGHAAGQIRTRVWMLTCRRFREWKRKLSSHLD